MCRGLEVARSCELGRWQKDQSRTFSAERQSSGSGIVYANSKGKVSEIPSRKDKSRGIKAQAPSNGDARCSVQGYRARTGCVAERSGGAARKKLSLAFLLSLAIVLGSLKLVNIVESSPGTSFYIDAIGNKDTLFRAGRSLSEGYRVLFHSLRVRYLTGREPATAGA
jgi:hypothetical protein